MQKYIKTMTGYKATDSEMKCRGFQFELGRWYECPEGDIIRCGANGFHFCEQPSGPWAYYSDPTSRIFKVECQDVLDEKQEPGADAKRVCRKIRLVEEITVTGDQNTGDQNTGNRNTGYLNTGNLNTGNRNTGNRNTGNRNTGYLNTGYLNTGNRNTGNRNTGNRNTGYLNTGYLNTGNRNTGDGNATNYSSGFFCVNEPTVLCFDTDSGLSRELFVDKYPEYFDLCIALASDEPIQLAPYANLPGITAEKLAILHAKHIAGREKGCE